MMRLCKSLKSFFSIRVRYAPSPTGFMHIGGLRTALFNYLFARKHKGSFILRIQDTDQQRHVQGSIDNIFDSLAWIGISADQSIRKEGSLGPYVQSQRLHIYKQIQKQLLKQNKAYPCFCSQKQTQGKPYDGRCRGLSFEQIKNRIKGGQQYAVRVKSDIVPWPNSFHDQVYGDIQFKPIDDFVLVRRNGWPTFHLANVVDDWKMGITHVMRGQQWLTNTNKHVYLYNLLGAPLPRFVHLPLIKNMQGKKLAKRDPSSSAKFFQQKHYESQALKSFMFRLGLTRPNKEEPKNQKISNKKKEQGLRLMTQEEMIAQISLQNICRNPAKFDQKQLDFLNRQAIKKRWKKALTKDDQMKYFVDKLRQFQPKSLIFSQEICIKVLSCVAERLTLITDLKNFTYFFDKPDFSSQASIKDIQYLFGKTAHLTIKQKIASIQGADPSLLSTNRKIIHNIRMIFQHVISPQKFTEIELAKGISEFLFQSPQLKNEDVFHLLRFAVTGRRSGPNIVATCAILGQSEVVARLSVFSSL